MAFRMPGHSAASDAELRHPNFTETDVADDQFRQAGKVAHRYRRSADSKTMMPGDIYDRE